MMTARKSKDIGSASAARRSFITDTCGATAVEFGLIMVPFLGLMMAIFQAGFAYFASENLQAATQSAARNLFIGTAQGKGVSTASAFVSQYMCPTGGGPLASFIDCTKLIVDVRVSAAGTFAGLDTSADFYQAGSATKFCPGRPGDIVIVRVIYPLPVFLPLLGTTNGRDVSVIRTGTVNDVPGVSGWQQLLLGTAVFRNEPFASSYSPPSGC